MNITFYINKNNKPHTLAELIISLKGSIYIHCNDQSHATRISDELWSYNRFIPNSLDQDLPPAIIQIGYQDIPPRTHIINASDTLLPQVTIEWVTQNLDIARNRYKTLNKTHTLTTHTIE